MLWYRDIQQKYGITPYVAIDKPDPFVTQVRYQAGRTEILLFINSSTDNGHRLQLSVNKEIGAGRQAWVWDAVTGERWHIGPGQQKIDLDLSPADSRLLIFDQEKKGQAWKPLPVGGNELPVSGSWAAEFKHIDGSVKTAVFSLLRDLKTMPEWVSFSGTVTYRTECTTPGGVKPGWLNLGKVAGISEVKVNGRSLGIQWFGRRIYPLADVWQNGKNTVEVKVVTSMGNYMKTLKDNAVAQYWTNEKRKDQPIQSMGLIGPVTIY